MNRVTSGNSGRRDINCRSNDRSDAAIQFHNENTIGDHTAALPSGIKHDRWRGIYFLVAEESSLSGRDPYHKSMKRSIGKNIPNGHKIVIFSR